MPRVTGPALAAALACLIALPAAAAVGTWSCQDGRQYTGSLASSSEVRSFEMAVYPDGTVEGAGQVQMVNGGGFQYRFAGRWQLSGTAFDWAGQSSINGAEMTFHSRLLDQATMAANWTDPASGARVATNCRRLR